MIYFTKDHEWIKILDGKKARVGITDHAQEQLGDIVFVDYTADLGDVAGGDEVVTVESVKSVSDVFAPVAGTLTAFNDNLNDSPETVNESAMEDGWMFELEIANEADLETLLSAEAYEALLAEEG